MALKPSEMGHGLAGLSVKQFLICKMGILKHYLSHRCLTPKNLLLEIPHIFQGICMVGRNHRNWLQNVLRSGSPPEPFAELF